MGHCRMGMVKRLKKGNLFMASTTSTIATARTVVMERPASGCNVCNGDASLNATTTSTSTRHLCPRCNDQRLFDIPNSNPNILDEIMSQLPTTPPDSVTRLPRSTGPASDDNFLLDSPYFHRLIHHLTHSNESYPSTTTTITTTSRHHSPTSKSAIEAIPTVTITSAFFDIDPIVLCAICKDQFLIDDETKQLPCKHMYHPDCILTWLSQHNSCPICRFQFPKEPVDVSQRRRSRSRVFSFGDLNEDVDDEAMLGIGFSNLHQHQYLEPVIDPDVTFPYTQIGQTVEVDVLPDSELDNVLDDLSSWPNWRVNGGAVDGGENGDNADVIML